MLFFTARKCIWAIFPRCFFQPQKNAFGWCFLDVFLYPPKNISRWFSLDVFFKESGWFWFSLVFSPLGKRAFGCAYLYGCHNWTVWLFAFPKTLQKSSDPCGGEMKNIICNAKQCAHAFRIKASELWVAHRGRRVSQRRRQPVSVEKSIYIYINTYVNILCVWISYENTWSQVKLSWLISDLQGFGKLHYLAGSEWPASGKSCPFSTTDRRESEKVHGGQKGGPQSQSIWIGQNGCWVQARCVLCCFQALPPWN